MKNRFFKLLKQKICINTLLVSLLAFGLTTLNPSVGNAGLFDCVKAKKYSGYSKLRTAYFKDPEKKTDSDWFAAYTFATIFNGYPKCFKKNDVAVMRDFIKAIVGVCAQNRNWGTICKLSPVRGALNDWAYDGYKR